MTRIILTTFFITYFSCLIHAQWISFEVGIGPSKSKNVITEEVSSGSSTYGVLDGLDTIFIRSEFSYREINQKKVFDVFALHGLARTNLPVKPKWTISTGIGIETTHYKYRDVDETADFMQVKDTLSNFIPTPQTTIQDTQVGPGGSPSGITHDGQNCDTLINRVDNRLHTVTTRHDGLNLLIPFDISYELIPESLNLRLGSQFRFALTNQQSYTNTRREKDERLSTEEFTVCSDFYNSTLANERDVSASISVSAVAQVEAILNRNMRAFVSLSKSFNSITNPSATPSDPNNRIAINYTPLQIKLGLGIDLFFSEDKGSKKSNFLFGTHSSDN